MAGKYQINRMTLWHTGTLKPSLVFSANILRLRELLVPTY